MRRALIVVDVQNDFCEEAVSRWPEEPMWPPPSPS